MCDVATKITTYYTMPGWMIFLQITETEKQNRTEQNNRMKENRIQEGVESGICHVMLVTMYHDTVYSMECHYDCHCRCKCMLTYLVKFFLDVCCYILLYPILGQCSSSHVNGFLLHLFAHISILDDCTTDVTHDDRWMDVLK